ncbi:MAG: multiprotein-bridging factor 1 family protein [Candidatus Micrarchaeia archaeon]
MGECEICGAPEAGYLVQVEGAKLNVCRDCSGSGKLIRAPQRQAEKGEEAPANIRQEMEVVEGFGRIISEARRKNGLPIEVLAERINEKLSFLERVEHERTLPDEKLCRKLERELGVKLLEATASGTPVTTPQSKGGMTLGDILEISQRKKKQE